MRDVSFEEEYVSSLGGRGKRLPPFERFVVRLGLARDRKSARLVLFVFTILCVLVSGFLFYTSRESTVPIADTIPPLNPDFQ